MPYVLGIDIGDTSLRAAVSRVAGPAWAPPELVRLDPPGFAIPSVLYVTANGSWSVGDPVLDAAPVRADQIARGFLRRVGDDIPLSVGSQPWMPQTLVAMLAMWVVERVLAWEESHPEHIVISHPAGWGRYRRELLHEALWNMGLSEITLLPEPVLAAEAYLDATAAGQMFGVYAMGGNSFSTSVVRRTIPDGFELLGCMDGVEPLGAEDLDEAGVGDEFEEVIRPAIQLSAETLTQTVRSLGLQADQLDGVLLAGAAARIPLIAEMLSTEFPGRIMLNADPQFLVAAGAAQAAVRIVAPQPSTGPYDYDDPRWPATIDDPDRYPSEIELPSGHPQADDDPPRPPVRISKLLLPRRSGLVTARPARLHAR